MDCDNIPYSDDIEAMDTQNDPVFNEETEDQARSEATFSFKIENFSKMNQQILSPAHYVRSLPWKIMAVQRNPEGIKYLGFFLQCNAENESTNWTCHATAELRIMPLRSGAEPFCRKINHLFHSKENDWGFSHFLAWDEILNPEKCFCVNDTILLEVHVSADAPHGVGWDSKKHTGYVGLKNQGATCYMNSLLQTLYFTNQLRKAVYKMPTESDDSSKSVALALQRVFYDLQFFDKPVGTKKLTKSFGWETLDSFMQHDVQEFLRVLLDKLESKMKGTCMEGMVPKLFEGKMISYIKCKNVPYTSSRIETYYDIQLNIKGKLNIEESFKDYVATELLNGDNRYDAGEYGHQDAEKGVIFSSFPPILHLHLMRFQYDPITDNSIKFNDRFEFSEVINLDKFLEQPEKTPATYILHAVLVHSGDNHGGHYVVFLNTDGKGKWCKFDDDVVSCCKKEEAINQNYGGDDDDLNLNTRNCSNAYMLVYIRESELKNVLQEVKAEDIPDELNDRLNEEKRMENIKRIERNEANSVITINVILEDYFEIHQTSDLFNVDRVSSRAFKVKKVTKICELVSLLSTSFGVPINKLRLWPLLPKPLQSIRPVPFDFNEKGNDIIAHYVGNQNSWQLFVEFLPFDSPDGSALKQFDKENEVLLFLKCCDPIEKRLNYCGSLTVTVGTKISEILPILRKRANLPPNCELTLHRENGNSVEIISNQEETFKKLADCPILIFQTLMRDPTLELPTCEEYFKDLLCRVEVTFVDKNVANDSGFVLELSNRANYDQMAKAVAHRINTDPYTIQFFKCQNYKDIPGQPLSCSFTGNLSNIFQCTPKSMKKIFYQRLNMNINELESKKQFKCLWLAPNMKDEKELILYPNKSGTVKNLLDEAAKVVEFSENGTKRLRISEINGHKILPGPPDDTQLHNLHSGNENLNSQKIYRLEEIPPDELEIGSNEMLIPVSHFYKEVYNTFGIPFFIKVAQDEAFVSIKARIQKKLNVPDKEFEKFKFAIIAMGRIEHITDDTTKINLTAFNSAPNSSRPFLGLEHMNKSQKRSRFNYLEKAIKIYN